LKVNPYLNPMLRNLCLLFLNVFGGVRSLSKAAINKEFLKGSQTKGFELVVCRNLLPTKARAKPQENRIK